MHETCQLTFRPMLSMLMNSRRAPVHNTRKTLLVCCLNTSSWLKPGMPLSSMALFLCTQLYWVDLLTSLNPCRLWLTSPYKLSNLIHIAPRFS